MTWWQIVLVSLGSLIAHAFVGVTILHYFHHVEAGLDSKGPDTDSGDEVAVVVLVVLLWPLLVLAIPWMAGRALGKRLAKRPAEQREALKRLGVKKS